MFIVLKTSLDFHVSSTNALKQNSLPTQNVSINSQSIAAVQPILFVIKLKSTNCHVVGVTVMNLFKAIWSIHQMHLATSAFVMKNMIIELMLHKTLCVNQWCVVSNYTSWAIYSLVAFQFISTMVYAAHSNSNVVRILFVHSHPFHSIWKIYNLYNL